MRRFVLITLLMLVAGPAMAQANLHDASGTFTGLLDMIRVNANSWSNSLRNAAMYVFWTLALIQLVWTFGMMALRQADFGEMASEMVRFIMTIGFFAALLMFSVQWAEAIVNSFRQAGAHAAGVGVGLKPGDMFALAVELAKTVGDVDTWNPVTAGMVGLAAVVILLCFTFIAAFMALTLVESYVVINASVLFMGFGGSQWTREYAVSMLKYSFAVGAKLFVLTLIVGLILESAKHWQLAYNMQHDEASMWTMVGLALVCAYLCKTIPELIQGLITGVSVGGGSVLGGMAAAGVAGAAAAMATMQSSGLVSSAGAAMGSVTDSIKSSLGLPSGGSSGPSMMNSGGGSGPGPSSRTGGGISSGPSPTPSPASGGASSGNTHKTASGMAQAAASTAFRGGAVLSSLAVPGMEDAVKVAASSPPAPIDTGMETPENIIRPAPQAAASESPIDTMSSLQDALNNKEGKS